ncbi:MAG TPA: porin [Pirellulales bacterium]|nr:porin [Pirellulales bacterium]
MINRFLIVIVAVIVLPLIGAGAAHAQTDTPPPAVFNPAVAFDGAGASNPASAADLQRLYNRLEQQDEELRQLRDQLGTLQNEVRVLPPVSNGEFPAPQPAGVVPAGAAESPQVFQLQDRLDAMEKRLDDQAAQHPSVGNSSADGYEVGSDLHFSATWNKGLQFETPNKDFRFHVGGVLQFDLNYFDNPPGIQNPASKGGIGPQPDSLDFRRIRLRMDGTMYEVFDWIVQVDFANMVTPAGTPNAQSPATTSPAFDEMYINWGDIPYIGNLRFGNIKEPMGFEHMMTDSQLPFMERSYLQDFVFGPFNGGYAPGIEMINWRQDLSATWSLGWFGADDDQFGFSLGNDYAGTGRLTWCPYYDEPSGGAYMMHLGVSGSVQSTDEGFVRLRTRGDIRSGPPGILNPIYVDTNYTGTINANSQNIFCGEFACVMGSFSVVAEYAGSTIPNATISGVDHGTPLFQGGYVQCAYLLTGEHEVYDRKRATFERIVPYENAFWVHDANGNCCHGWGAWQILARYNTIDLNDNGITGGELNSFTLGLNWIWNAQARMQFNYDFTDRSAVKTTPQADINSVGTRFSFDF